MPALFSQKFLSPKVLTALNRSFAVSALSISKKSQGVIRVFFWITCRKRTKRGLALRGRFVKSKMNKKAKSSILSLSELRRPARQMIKECVQKLAQTIDIVLDSADIETKRIGKISEQNGKQLLVKFKSQVKRKQFLRNSIKLRDSAFYSSVFVDLDLTKSEREAQYQLRVEKRTLQEKYSEKVFVIKNGKVIEKR